MIRHPAFSVEPWRLRETRLDLDALAQTESLFALSNGHIGWRANLEEGEPYGLPGSYLNGLYELRPLPYAEAGYGNPESGESVINVTNGKIIRLLVDDEPFDVRYGELHAHERMLDFRRGTLARRADWSSPAHQRVHVSSVRMVSLTQRAIAAIRYEVTPIDEPARIVIQSELVTNETLPSSNGDPRAASILEAPLLSEQHAAMEAGAALLHRTRLSGLRVGAVMDHVIDGADVSVSTESFEDVARVVISTSLEPGERLTVIKLVAYGWSAVRSLPAVRDQVAAALEGARRTGWDGLLREQRAYLDDFWSHADVEVEGDAEIQQALRFALFHVLQAGARAEGRAIPAKGLTGSGYDGHAFWDTETFVLPVLTYTAPDAAADALRWRHSTLPMALDRAAQLRLRGAAFPWRTIAGAECSGYWPAGTAAFHVGADIADAVLRYLAATGDESFGATFGVDLLVQTARLWRSLGHHDAAGAFRIDGVTGPDEYSAIADNNVYTNLMAQQNLLAAAKAALHYPERARELGVDAEEAAAWRDAADSMFVPYDHALGVHQQAEGFTIHQIWDFDNTAPDEYPLLLHFPYFDLYRKQVVKQADLVLAMQLRGDAFTDDEKVRNFAYYERLTVRDSSLSANTQAVLAAETGHVELAYDYLAETALIDLDDLGDNTSEGLHLAALAGTWIALVNGFGGMRNHEGLLSFAPRLPSALTRLAFTLCCRGRQVRVDANHTAVTYSVVVGDSVEIAHYGETFTVSKDTPVVRPVPRRRARKEPTQPPGRAPVRRSAITAEGNDADNDDSAGDGDGDGSGGGKRDGSS
ncbi:MAG: glycoside hydrolase family 65 protein [Actinobacteria bacterium]|nr:glycoside hydrolase family 65 protein [Actinomycetota bacterium]